MELTAAAQWINNAFYAADRAILGFYHTLAESAGGFLTPALGALTLTAWKGVFLIGLSLVLICFRKTRRAGFCALFAIGLGALLTNLILKHSVARPRPYDFDATLRQWWEFVGAPMETDFSFPSGHVTAACAFTTGFVLTRGRKWLAAGAVYVALVGVSRNYLIVHYPSDVLAGLVSGAAAGAVSFFVVRAVYRRWGGTGLLREI